MASVTRKETRDELSCVHCGKPGVALDHIKERSLAPELIDDPENCVALCPGCHDLKGKMKHVKTKVEDGMYQWRWKGSDQWIKPSVVVSKRHGMLIRESDGLPGDKKLGADRAAAEGRNNLRSEGSLDASGNMSSAAAPSASDTGAGSAGAEAESPSSQPAGEGSLDYRPALAPALTPLTEDWTILSDDNLQALYESAEKRQGLSFLVKCKAVHTFKEKHDWGDAWTEHAYGRFGASRRTLYAYANIWAICVTSDTFNPEKIAPLTDSKSLMQSIGRRSLEDGAVAMEAAIAHFVEFAEPPTVAALAHKLGEETETKARHECPSCGQDHTLRRVT